MKKKIFGLIAVLAIAAVATINITLSNGKTNALSDLQLANLEALAQESGGGGTTHSLSCGSAGIKACSGTCNIHQVTLTNYGNGGQAVFNCN